MKAKKIKDFANELIDDLLSTESDSMPPTVQAEDQTLNLGTATKEEKYSVPPKKYTGTTRGADASLIQSENLRVAQNKIFELEKEIERLRTDNEKLVAAGETLKKRTDELSSDNENKTRKLDDLKERVSSEKEILDDSLRAKDRELKELKLKMEEYELRISSNIQKIRVRERELENRLEISKMENAALIRNKDEIILDMKRQIDHLTHELENYRAKGQDLHKQLDEKQEALRRTVKALRLALSMLEGDGDGSGQKVS